ncbi:MAG: amino acid adenylation domain-containing protein [Planctomycetaceae bacterium]|jgi:amino acid adenylation domain-containing protein
MWFLHELTAPEPRLNGSRHFRLSGPVQRDALEEAVAVLVARHDVLRTSFSAIDGQPTPVVHSEGENCFEHEIAHSELGDRAFFLHLATQRRKAFDLSTPQVFRVTLQTLSLDDHLLHVVYHQIAVDDRSIEILLDELGRTYRALYDHADIDLKPAIQMTEDLNSPIAREEQCLFWSTELADVAPRVDLSAHRPPSEHQNGGLSIGLQLTPHVIAGIRRLADEAQTEVSNVLLVSLALLLMRWSASDDVLIGTPFSRRDASTASVVGPLENPLPMRVTVAQNQSFRDLVQDAAGRHRCVEENSQLPFSELVRELGRAGNADGNPLFGAHVRSRRIEHQQLNLGNVEAISLELNSFFARYEIDLTLSESAEEMSCSFTFSKDRFDLGVMEEFVAQYEHLLAAAVDLPDDTALILPLEASSVAIARVNEVNQTSVPYPRDRTLGELFHEVVAAHSDCIAIVDGEQAVTFQELGAQSISASQELVRAGVRAGDFVGILVRPDVATVTAMIATILVGAAYVPLDPDLPTARLREIRADAGSNIVVGNRRLAASLDIGPCTVIELGEDRRPPDEIFDNQISAGDPAYMIYTSGSTGRPKGVVVPHRSAVRQLINSDFLPLYPGDVVGQVSNLAFDVSIIEIWGPLLNGARIEMVPPACRLEPRVLVDFIREQGVTVLFLSSLHFAAVIREVPDALKTLDTFIVGADVVHPAPVRRAMVHGRPNRFVNAYGPTEASVWCCFAEINNPPNHRKDLPIGRPAANNTLYVLNAAGGLTAPWEQGELYVGGDGVASGYWRHPALTKEKFVSDPFSDIQGARMYATGDRVVQTVDGEIHFLGRTDRQVKIRGNRVELGEIEAKIAGLQGADSARIVVRGEGLSQRLVGYVVKSPDFQLTSAAVVEELGALLPGYMVPRDVVVVDELPINCRGKIDLDRLPSLEVHRSLEAVEPRGRLETSIAQCFADVLEVESVGTDRDFFSLGGHSLMALELLARIEKYVGLHISLVSFMRHSSVQRLVEYLKLVRQNEDRALTGDEQDEAGQLEPIKRMMGAWGGTRQHETSLLVQRNVDAVGRPLYWCFQGENELDTLAGLFGTANPLIGMRSAFGVCEPMSDMIPALARRYAGEIIELDPGPYVVGGNCAGAEVAFAVAWELERRGLEVELLIIMERVINAPYPGDVLMLYGRESQDFNPYLAEAPSDEVFEQNYGSYRVDIISGQHGRFFSSPNVEILSETLRRYLNDPFVDPLEPPLRPSHERARAGPNGPTRHGLTNAPDMSDAQLPPGDLARIDHGEHEDRYFLINRSQEFGTIFKATTSADRLVVCFVGFKTCKRLLREHSRDLGPNSLSLGELIPRGIIREMHGEDHATYRGTLIRALAGMRAPSIDDLARSTASMVLGQLAEQQTPSGPEQLLVALDDIATSTLVEIFFGVGPDIKAHGALIAGFSRLGPDGMVWVPEAPQKAAFADLRQQLWALARAPGNQPGTSVLHRLSANGDLDETMLGNLIYMVEIGRFDMASLMRWLVKLAAENSSILDEIHSSSESTGETAMLTDAFVLETLRLHQSERLMRVALEDLSFEGYLIPRGAIVRLCLWESHKDSDTFADPFRFDPSRFLRETYTSDHFAPFGLGSRRCPASDMAITLATALVWTMASGIRPEIVEDGPPIHGAWHWEPNPSMRVHWSPVTGIDAGQRAR